MRIPKSVSITPAIQHLIEKHFPTRGQFSAFVRAAVLDHDEHVTNGGGVHNPVVDLGICNAMRRPTCSICYPEGPPTQSDWLRFVSQVRLNNSIGGRPSDSPIPDPMTELLESVQPRPPSPRVDVVTGSFPQKLSIWQRIRRIFR